MRETLFLTLAVLAITGTANPATAASAWHLAAGLRATTRPLTQSLPPRADELHTCADVLELLVTGGGLLLANTNGWLILPDKSKPVRSFSCGTSDVHYVVQGQALYRIKGSVVGGRKEQVAVVPGGVVRLAVTGNQTVWLSQATADGVHALLRLQPDGQWRTVASGKRRIAAIAAAGKDTVATVVEDELVLWQGSTPTVVAKIGPGFDAVAMDGLGRLYVSGATGLFRLGADKVFHTVATGLRGPMDASRLTVFIARDGERAVVAISPRARRKV